MRFPIRGNEKGFAMVSVYFVGVLILAISGSTYIRAIVEAKEVGREITRQQIRSAAEAGLQSALVQIGANPTTGGIAYSGFINARSIPLTNLRNSRGTTTVGNFSVTITNPNQADWAVITATGGSAQDQSRITLEARVLLDSNFSKYMMYVNAPATDLGDNLQLGESDGLNPEGVPLNKLDRNMLYYTGDLTFSGSNIKIWGDVNAQGKIIGNSTSCLNGDSYSKDFAINSFGQVTNSGVSGGLKVGDGFSDDTDRNGDGFINAQDYPDYHGLTATGGGDSNKFEVVKPMNLNFYATQAQSVPGIDGMDVVRYGGGTNRYLKFETAPTGNVTRIIEYTNASYLTPIATRDLNSTNGLIYVNGNAYVQGEIKGRVTVVSSSNVFYTGNIKYSGNQSKVNPNAPDAAAFLAKNQQQFLPMSVEVSGIVYAEKAFNTNNLALALVGSSKLNQTFNGVVSILPGEKDNGHFRHYGNIIMNGTGNTNKYLYDRAFVYDPNLKYYRPPGLPVQPVIRLVREAPNP